MQRCKKRRWEKPFSFAKLVEPRLIIRGSWMTPSIGPKGISGPLKGSHHRRSYGVFPSDKRSQPLRRAQQPMKSANQFVHPDQIAELYLPSPCVPLLRCLSWIDGVLTNNDSMIFTGLAKLQRIVCVNHLRTGTRIVRNFLFLQW